MSELDEIRRRKLEEMQGRAQANTQEELQARQELEQLEQAVKQHMSKEALERYGNIKSASNDRALQLLLVLGQLLQSGRIKQVDDNTLKQILLQITSQKRDFKIKRK